MEGYIGSPCALLDNPNFTFNLSNMFGRRRCIQIDFRDVVGDVYQNCLHMKAGPSKKNEVFLGVSVRVGKPCNVGHS